MLPLSFEFRVAAVYVPNIPAEMVSFFRQLAPFIDDPEWIILVGDWNAILDPKIDRVGRGARGLGRCESILFDLITRYNLMTCHDLIDWFRVDHPGEMWTWLDSSPSLHARSNLDRMFEELTLCSVDWT